MRPLKQYISLITHMGVGWLLYRASYALRRRIGALRRATPAVSWGELPAPELSLRSGRIPTISAEWGDACVAEAEAILKGEFKIFSHRTVNAGFPPDWHRNQMTDDRGRMTEGGGQVSGVGRPSSEAHWSEISDSSGGDIKGIWELSRFPWAFVLTRSHARTGEKKYADAFWRLFADWCDRNPPNLGPNWMCGQEATFRLMAVTFAAEGLGVPPTQRESLARFVVATGRRINANLDYALSQKNNHGVSECVGLVTAALLVPAHVESAAWRARGLRELKTQLAELVYEDGGFSQHSLIYHRVLLHDLCWIHVRLAGAGEPVPVWFEAAGRRATDFLVALVNPETGRAPLYGSNDGANVLPLATADFIDMRPVVQMAGALFRRELLLPAGPWNEAAAWLVPDWACLARVDWPTLPARWHASASGCLQLANGPGRLFLRAPTEFRHRPAQADMLHVDVWHHGLPVAHDGGSFSYNSKERFSTLACAAQHNVINIGGIEPLQKFSRFLYLPWPGGEAAVTDTGGFQASYAGYAQQGIDWVREVSPRRQGGFVVRDRLWKTGGRLVTWHWRLFDGSWQMSAANDAVVTNSPGRSYRISWTGPAQARARLIRADASTAHGWWSPYYGEVEPAVSLLIELDSPDGVELAFEFQAVT